MSTTPPLTGEKPSGPRSRKGVETRARLIAAAKEVFERDGFLDARISDIAEQAGLSHGSFYHYFESKEEVFREVAAGVEERLREPLYSVILDSTSTAPPFERIHEGIRRNLEATGTRRASWASSSRCRASTRSSALRATSDTTSRLVRSPIPSGGCNATAWPTRDSTPTSPPLGWVP